MEKRPRAKNVPSSDQWGWVIKAQKFFIRWKTLDCGQGFKVYVAAEQQDVSLAHVHLTMLNA